MFQVKELATGMRLNQRVSDSNQIDRTKASLATALALLFGWMTEQVDVL